MQCGKNDAQFREVVEKGYLFYKRIGIKAMNVLSAERTVLDDNHAMVKVNWKAVYTRDGRKKSLDFPVIYFLQLLSGKAQLFAYISADEQKGLREAGLIG